MRIVQRVEGRLERCRDRRVDAGADVVLEDRVAVDVREERAELRDAPEHEGRAGVTGVVPLLRRQLVADLVVAEADDEGVLGAGHARAVALADLGIELAQDDGEARLVDAEGADLRAQILAEGLGDHVEGGGVGKPTAGSGAPAV
ncbi:MAG: hypothetical protein R3E53_03890 [Myxococcota bacterium]